MALKGNIHDLLLIDNFENLTHAELCELIRIYKDYIKSNVNPRDNNSTIRELGNTVNKLNVEINKLKLELDKANKLKQNYKNLYNTLTRKLTLLERIKGKINLKLLTKE